MAEDPFPQFAATCEELGEAEVRTRLETNQWGNRAALARKWLHLQEEMRMVAREERADRALAAAEISAKAAEDAAKISQDSADAARISARWTFWAAVIALLTVAVSVIPGCLQRLFP